MSADLGLHTTVAPSHSPLQQAQPDLRHVTSTTLRSPRRTSHKTSEARLGSRSPGSIPSSPTSVHSSSSAIFERDIEPAVPPSPPISSNPHRIPRAKTTEHLEQSVPSVLDSAAEILTRCHDPEAGDQIAVITPAASSFTDAGRSSGFTSPIGSFRSRSPSPLGLRLSPGAIGAGQRADLLLSIPQQNQQHPPPIPVVATPPVSSSPRINTSYFGAPPNPTIQTNFGQETRVNPTPSLVTPTSAYFTSASSVADDESSPTATSHDERESIKASPAHVMTTAAAMAVASSPLNAFSPSIYSANTSHPPSPTHVATKRLSFMSYSDLLSSTPASTYPLSMLTTSASSIDPPPHLPSVCSLTQVYPHPTGSAAGSLRGFAMNGNSRLICQRDSLFDDVGGEWEREGFGKGLEERLETLMPATSPIVGQKA